VSLKLVGKLDTTINLESLLNKELGADCAPSALSRAALSPKMVQVRMRDHIKFNNQLKIGERCQSNNKLECSKIVGANRAPSEFEIRIDSTTN